MPPKGRRGSDFTWPLTAAVGSPATRPLCLLRMGADGMRMPCELPSTPPVALSYRSRSGMRWVSVPGRQSRSGSPMDGSRSTRRPHRCGSHVADAVWLPCPGDDFPSSLRSRSARRSNGFAVDCSRYERRGRRLRVVARGSRGRSQSRRAGRAPRGPLRPGDLLGADASPAPAPSTGGHCPRLARASLSEAVPCALRGGASTVCRDPAGARRHRGRRVRCARCGNRPGSRRGHGDARQACERSVRAIWRRDRSRVAPTSDRTFNRVRRKGVRNSGGC